MGIFLYLSELMQELAKQFRHIMNTIIKDLWSGILSIEFGENQQRITIKSKSTLGREEASVDLSNEEFFDLISEMQNLHIRNGSYVALEAAPELKGTVVKTHLPMHGDVTYDVQISYKASATWENPEVMRLRDIPTRCLIKLDNELLKS